MVELAGLVIVNWKVPLELTILPNCSGCEAMGLAVITLSDQPLEMAPTLPGESSITNSDQVPFGLLPMKVDKLVAYGGTGAGAGNMATGK